MTRIERRDFVDTLSRGGGTIDVANIPDATLDAAGITRADLQRVAGEDGVFSGKGEYGALYDRLRELDKTQPVRKGERARLDRANDLYRNLLRTSNASELSEPVRAEVDRLTALDPAPQVKGERSYVPVATYLDAVDAREAGATRPKHVPERVWAMTRALEMQGIGATDVRHFLATGELPPRLDKDGLIVESGADRWAALRKDVRQNGEWTAQNSFSFLMGMQRSSLAAERVGIGGDDSANRKADQAIAKELYTIHSEGTAARERIARKKLARARALETQAAKLDATDPAKAKTLRDEAAVIRQKATQDAVKEAKYRDSVPGFGFDGGATWDVAAIGQIDRADAKIDQEIAAGKLSPTVHAELSDDPAVVTENGIPGAGVLLDNAVASNPKRANNQEHLSIEGRRHAVTAKYHKAHLDAGRYTERTITEGAPPLELVNYRRGYLDARIAQLDVADKRLDLYGGPGKVSKADAIDAARVEGERQEITSELARDLADASGAERLHGDAKQRAADAEEGVTDTAKSVDEARKNLGESKANEEETKTAAGAVFGDAGKFAAESKRDDESVSDSEIITRGDRASFNFARGQAFEAEQNRTAAKKNEVEAGLAAAGLNEDAKLVLEAYNSRKTERGMYTNVSGAAHHLRGEADHVTRNRSAYLDVASKNLPADPKERTSVKQEIALARADNARYWTSSSLIRERSEGEPGLADARDRLGDADRELALAEKATGDFTGVAHDRFAYGVAAIRTDMGEAWGALDPRAAVDHLDAAERYARTELGAGTDLGEKALDRVGTASVSALLRHQNRFDFVFIAGDHDPTADDELYAKAGALLQDREVVSPTGERGQEQLAKVDAALQAVDPMLEAAKSQIEAGQAVIGARVRQIGKSEGKVAQAPVSRVISGPTWAVTKLGNALFGTGVVDMRGQIADKADERAAERVTRAGWETTALTGALDDLRAAWRSAQARGEQFQFLNALKVETHRSLGGPQPSDAQLALDYLDARVSDHTTNKRFKYFNSVVVPNVPVAKALTGNIGGFEPALRTLGMRDLPVTTPAHRQALDEAAASFQETKDDVGLKGHLVIGLEVVLAAVVTRGMGTGFAFGRGAQGVQSVSALATAGRAAVATIAVGGVMMGASWGVRRLFGANTAVAGTFDTISNFLPIGAGHRAAGLTQLSNNAIRAARVGQVGQRILAHAAPAALAFGQGFGTSLGTEELAGKLGIRSELGQMALGLGLNTLFSAGVGYGTAKYASAKRVAALYKGMLDIVGAENAGPRTHKAVQGELTAFLKGVGDRVPTAGDMAKLRGRIYAELGVDPRATDLTNVEKRQAIDGFTESLRVERAAAKGMAGKDLSKETDVHASVEAAAAALLESRGGEGVASRGQAFRESAGFIARTLRADGKERAAVQAEARGVAAELASGLEARGVFGADAARKAEKVFTAELSGGSDTRPVTERVADAQFFTRLEGKLVREAGLTADQARTAADAVKADLVERGVLQTTATETLGRIDGARSTPRALQLAAEPAFQAAALRDPDGARKLLEANESGQYDLAKITREHGVGAAETLVKLHAESPAALGLFIRKHGGIENATRLMAVDPAAAIAEAKRLPAEHLAKVDPAGAVKMAALSGADSKAALSRAEVVQQNEATSGAQLSVDELAAMGLEPRWSMEVEGTKVLVSDPFDLGQGRTGMVGYVESEGRLHARVFYRSNTQSMWRVSDASVEGHYGKGISEIDTALPVHMTAAAHRMAAEGLTALHDPSTRKTATDSVVADRAFNGLVELYTVDQMIAANNNDPSAPANLVGHDPHYYTKSYAEDRESISVGSKRNSLPTNHPQVSVPDPGGMRLPPAEKIPDFTKEPETRFEIESSGYAGVTGNGKLTAEVYPSRDGSLRYLVIRDSEGRMAIAGAEATDSKLSAWGNRKKYVDLNGMDAPLFEYEKQIAKFYGGEEPVNTRQSNWAYVRETPLVKEIYRQRGEAIPEAVPESAVKASDADVARVLGREGLERHVARGMQGLLDARLDLDVAPDVAATAREKMTAQVKSKGEDAARFIVTLGDRIGPQALAELYAAGHGDALFAARDQLTQAKMAEIRKLPAAERAEAVRALLEPVSQGPSTRGPRTTGIHGDRRRNTAAMA